MNLIISQIEEALAIIGKERVIGESLKKWAKSLFDESLIHALPLTNAKKKFTLMEFN